MSPLCLPCSSPAQNPFRPLQAWSMGRGQGTPGERLIGVGPQNHCLGWGQGCPAHVLTLSHGELLQSRGDPSAGTYLTLVLFLKMPT